MYPHNLHFKHESHVILDLGSFKFGKQVQGLLLIYLYPFSNKFNTCYTSYKAYVLLVSTADYFKRRTE